MRPEGAATSAWVLQVCAAKRKRGFLWMERRANEKPRPCGSCTCLVWIRQSVKETRVEGRGKKKPGSDDANTEFMIMLYRDSNREGVDNNTETNAHSAFCCIHLLLLWKPFVSCPKAKHNPLFIIHFQAKLRSHESSSTSSSSSSRIQKRFVTDEGSLVKQLQSLKRMQA